MTRKQILSFIFALLITSNNSLARPNHSNDDRFLKYLVAVSIVAITAIIVVPKILQWLSSHISVSGNYYVSRNYSISNNEIIINPGGSSLNLNSLDLIEPSGIIETDSFDEPIHTIDVPGYIALIGIDSNEQPHIKRDAAFKDILFSVNNGTLTATTIDGKPRKFIYGGEPLCKIYAQLLNTSLKAQGSANVHIINQKLHSIIIEDSSVITGSLNEEKTNALNLGCYGSSDMNLTNINTQKLNATLSGSVDIKVAGKADNEEINVSGSGKYDGSELICQGGYVQAQSSGSGNIITAGMASHQDIALSG